MDKRLSQIRCIRNREQITLSWLNPDGEGVSIFYNGVPEADGNEKFLGRSAEGQITFADPLSDRRTYLILKKPGYRTEILAERELPMTGICNFRDLGGYPTADGRHVKWGKFYRSGSLHKLNEADYEKIKSLGLKTIIDYRAAHISAAEPDDQFPGTTIITMSATPEIDKVLGALVPGNLLRNPDKFRDFDSIADIMKYGYRNMPFANEAFHRMISIVKRGDGAPVLQHCDSGKDRAGFGSALLLLLLGVPFDIVREDYLASNTYIKICNTIQMDKLQALLDSEERVEQFTQIMQVNAGYLEAAFDMILEKYASFEEYLAAEFQCYPDDVKRIRNLYLY